MHCATRFIATVVISILGVPALAEAPEHFEGEPAETLEQAVANFSEFNRQLETLLHGDLDPRTMQEIHKLTYTLENAVDRLETELDEIAGMLESVHVAAEQSDRRVVREQGAAYLEKCRTIIR